MIYVNEGRHAAFTNAPHAHLSVISPVMIGFATAFVSRGLRHVRRQVLS